MAIKKYQTIFVIAEMNKKPPTFEEFKSMMGRRKPTGPKLFDRTLHPTKNAPPSNKVIKMKLDAIASAATKKILSLYEGGLKFKNDYDYYGNRETSAEEKRDRAVNNIVKEMKRDIENYKEKIRIWKINHEAYKKVE